MPVSSDSSWLVEEVEDVVAGGGRRLHLGHALGQGAQGRGEQPHIEDEGHDDAEGDLPGHGQGGAQDAHRHIAQVAHDVHHGLHDAGEELAAPLRVVEGGVHAAEGLLDLSFARERRTTSWPEYISSM